MRSFLLLLFVAWVAGIAGGVVGIAGWWLVLGGLAVVGWIIAARKFEWSLPAAMIFLIALGWAYGWSAGLLQVTTCDDVEGKAAVVEGQPEYMEKQIRFVARIDGCRILVSASPWLTVGRKDRVIISGGRRQSLAEVKEFSVGYADYLGRRGIGATWFYPQVKVQQMNNLEGWAGSSYTQILSEQLRHRTQKLFVEPDASLVMGMLLAQKGMIPERITQQFRATGVSHILAISGLHVTIIAGIIYTILLWFPLPKWWRTAAMLLALWMYVIFIGVPVSAVRAGSFISAALIFIRLSKLASLPTALALTVMAMVTYEPRVVLEVSWQMSVGAVAGIFLVLFLSRTMEPFHQKGGLALWLYRLFLVSLGATLMTWPLAAYHFGTVSLIGVVANLLVVPTVPLILMLAIMAIVVSYGWMAGGLMLAGMVHWLMRWIELVTGQLAVIPGAFWDKVELSWWAVAVYYAVVVAAAVILLHWQKRSWREVWG